MALHREMKSNGDDRRRLPHSPAEKPLRHFFKIILPSNLNDMKLRIPTKFVRNFGNELSDVANFITPNCRLWKVGLRKVHNDIWFDDGWHDFVKHHSICIGYLLVFGYRGFSDFSVFIFDVSACEIEYPCNDQGLVHGEKCRIQNQVEVEDDNPTDVFGSGILSPSCSSLKSKVCDASASKEEPSKEVAPAEQNLGMKKRSRVVVLGGHPYLKRNYETRSKKVKVEQLDQLTNIDANESRKGTLDRYEMSWSHEVNELQDRSRSRVKSGENQLLPRCEEDIEIITSEMFEVMKFSPGSMRAIHAARKYSPKHPSFMVVLYPYNCCNNVLYVPRGFSEKYLSEAPNYLILEVSDGREWQVRVRKNCRRLDLGRGLTAFFRDNNLKAGDVCIFELIKNTESVPRIFSKWYLWRARKCIKVKVSDGREWTICLQKSCKHLVFQMGWKEFCKDNNLKAGDVCVFELITKNRVLKASIFHANQDAGPEN
ncbi:B3 domain-containing transcription factor VRN1 isoform X2 [Ricinus communis]|uniref:B3 domain-containing transcription factor VRN1 isoform X2 n=1 Tax=Ricinus communis TaxID=3988 RepID=UPI000772521A|nr:B3 domain-containing transcription factor VRN1 isoform X2 [Ricinus communis]|eukprot:XP_015574589.1 B3 domain-containing transcription factor VRN1 isoform X2 [Ricinus communis]